MYEEPIDWLVGGGGVVKLINVHMGGNGMKGRKNEWSEGRTSGEGQGRDEGEGGGEEGGGWA